MAAVLNGLSLSKIRPFGSGFLIFSDYSRAAIRLSALMEIPVIHIFTHDSIGVGEDGPTHQPVEQLASLRAIPGLITLRPADANETVEAWRVITPLRHQPVALILTRQAVPTIDRTKYASADGVRRGAYVLADSGDGLPDVILLATGSEVSLCLAAYEQLNAEGIKARVVSMPSWELFEQHCRTSPAYRTEVLPESVTARVSVEKGSTLGWARYVGTEGQSIGMDTFGASAPLQELLKKFGFTVENVVAAARITGRAYEVTLCASRLAAIMPGFELKEAVKGFLVAENSDVLDVGTHSTEPVDYSDFAAAVGEAVRGRRAERGIILCGSGVGVSMAANKMPGIRAGLCHDTYSAHQGVEHDDMNVLVLGGRVIGVELARELIHTFLNARFTGEQRHLRRLAKMTALENPLRALQVFGQSVWLDYIRRTLITSGELRALIDDDGLRGVTSNPSIFEKALTGSSDYRDVLESPASHTQDPKRIYERLAVRDIRDAADALRSVYDETEAR
jgi:RpiB/LacA/LacB family sugar-phosphate isomerase